MANVEDGDATALLVHLVHNPIVSRTDPKQSLRPFDLSAVGGERIACQILGSFDQGGNAGPVKMAKVAFR